MYNEICHFKCKLITCIMLHKYHLYFLLVSSCFCGTGSDFQANFELAMQPRLAQTQVLLAQPLLGLQVCSTTPNYHYFQNFPLPMYSSIFVLTSDFHLVPVVVCTRVSLHFMHEQYSIEYVYFSHLSVDGYWGCLHHLAIINTGSMNTGKRIWFKFLVSLHLDFGIA